jgi:acyl-CoA dehydrogenase
MADRTYLAWPFFDEAHRNLQRDVEAWRNQHLGSHDDADPFAACRAYVAALGKAGWLKYAVPRAGIGGRGTLVVRSL